MGSFRFEKFKKIMAAWYWFVIAGVAVVVIGGTIFILTRGGDEEEAAAMEDMKESRSLEDLAENGIKLAIDGEEHFMAPEDPASGYSWVLHDGCEDIAEVSHKFKAPMDKEDKEGKDDEKDADEKKDSAKSLQKDDEEADENEEKEEKADTGARWFMVKGVAEGECEIKIAHVEEDGDFDWEDEDTWESAKEIVKIPVTVGGDDEEKDGDDEKEDKDAEEKDE